MMSHKSTQQRMPQQRLPDPIVLIAVALTVLLTGALPVAGPVAPGALHVDPGECAPRAVVGFAFYSPILEL